MKLILVVLLAGCASALPVPPSNDTGNLTECGAVSWVHCGASVLACASQCTSGFSACVTCLGDAFPTCCPCLANIGIHLQCNAFEDTPISVLSPEQAAQLWINAGGSKSSCPTAIAVASAESSLNPSAKLVNSDQWHSVDRGLYQINDHWHPEVSDSCAYDATCNTRAALSISGGSNWTPWHTYTSGAYKRYLSSATSGCNAAGQSFGDDCCLSGNCCHGVEYCCDTCNGSCRCSVNGKCY